ncbi:right-handed parallel beta-helix repeat-containing protein [Taibaiella soli]|uniref:Ig-like domain-containing protein n=1 Tax=Taibaiella soli TaxID=1649169 RepID=A0A2W2BBV9_9BACT|nr:right-handed parallel beta-helix repeat-containing protein [Taibaiella soli]PZF73699.1 hypothetical protein DN068_06800 [Taibaiella soli]
MFRRILYLTALLAFTYTVHASVRYVTVAGAGLQDGSSWTNAASDIQAMINASSVGDQIWVANGRYLPTHLANNTSAVSLNNRTNAFVMKADVQLYGGFSGGETSVTQRDSVSNLTILSGDLGTLNTNIDNAYHVVIASGSMGTATLNSFGIKRGYANGIDSALINGSYVLQSAGGGIACYNTSFTIANCAVDSNYADKGAGIYNAQSTPTIANCSIKGNSSSLSATSSGGGIYNYQSAAVITNCYVLYNTGQGAGVFNYFSSPVITNSVLRYNSVYNSGPSGCGGMYNYRSAPAVTGCTFNRNYGAYASVYNDSASAPTFTNCSLDTNNGSYAIYNRKATVVFNNCTISGNYTIGIYSYKTALTITNSSVKYNSQGGVINFNTSGAIINSVFSNNTYGTVVNDSFSSPIISGCTINNNNGGYTGKGGGIYNNNYSSPVITNCIIKQNSAVGNNGTGYGGGICNNNHCSPTVSNCTISTNSVNGSSLACGGGVYNGISSAPAFTNCIISNNQLNYGKCYGAGVCNDQSSAAVFSSCTISQNTFYSSISEYGGGVCNRIASPATFNNCSMTYNGTSSTYGGGVFNDSSLANFTSCLIAANNDYQGGVYNQASASPVFTNCTIANNQSVGLGGGIWQFGGNVKINNSIVWGNNVGSGIYLGNTSAAFTAKYSLIDGQTSTANGNIVGTSDPLFTDTAAGNYYLLPASPCINTGSNPLYVGNLNTDLDLAARPRLVGTTVDMGAYEVCTGLPTITTQPVPATTCFNSAAGFSAVLSSTNGLSFQWQKDGQNIQGATTTSYLIPTATYIDTGIYKLVITSAVCGNMFSDSVKLRVKAPPAITQQPSTVGTVVCSGGWFSLTCIATNATHYQWLKNGVAITGATTVNYSVLGVQATDSGTYVFQAIDSCGNIATSQNTVIAVTPSVTPTITIATPHTSLCQGGQATFTVNTTHGGTNPNYQWFKNGYSIGTNSPTFTYTPANNEVISCEMYSSEVCLATLYATASNNITMTVYNVYNTTASFTIYPGANVTAGQQVTFASYVNTGGAQPAYQWKKNSANISGATGANYVAIAGTDFQNNDLISLKVTNTDPCGNSYQTSDYQMKVTGGTGVGNVTNTNSDFSLYPNPNDGSFTIKGVAEGLSTVTLEVYNMLGQSVYNEEASVENGQLNQKLNLEKSLPSGNYFLKINGVGTTVIRFTINRN